MSSGMPILQGFPGFLYAVWLYFGSIRKILFQTEWRIEPLDMLFFRISIQFECIFLCTFFDNAAAVNEMVFDFCHISLYVGNG